PPGAEVKLPNGQTCVTPCASPLTSNNTYTVEYSLIGYEPATETIAPVPMGDGTTQLRPNPVTADLIKVEPPKKVRHRRSVVRRTAHKPVRKPAPKPAPAAAAPAPAPQQAPSPWPPAQPPQR
ncbi:MAG TPA: hypothetical protein VE224_17180, partial [Pseudolabrys sp.]|nr:hypothetical protein [Pseudolabrys sp.]